MKELHLTKSDLLPSITEADNEFALKVKKKYNKISFDDLCLLIRNIRYDISDEFSELKETVSELVDIYNKKLYSPGIEIHRIIVETNKGEVYFQPDDPFTGSFFKTAIRKTENKLKKSKTKNENAIKHISYECIFAKIVTFAVLNSGLGPYQQIVFFGYFLVHFKIYKGEHLDTEDEFEIKRNEGKYLNYNNYGRYLKSRLENIFKKYSTELSINSIAEG